MKALTFWPEWAATFPGVRFRDGTPSPLDKLVENRPSAPWSTIAPTMHGPGPWVAMHAGAEIGGKPARGVPAWAHRDAALALVARVARDAGWSICWTPDQWWVLRKGLASVDLREEHLVTSAIVALFRVTRADPPGVGGLWRMADRWGWHVDFRALPEPIPCAGAQGLWTVPELIAVQLQESP